MDAMLGYVWKNFTPDKRALIQTDPASRPVTDKSLATACSGSDNIINWADGASCHHAYPPGGPREILSDFASAVDAGVLAKYAFGVEKESEKCAFYKHADQGA